MALSKEDREQFLAEPHIAALSVSAGAGRGPLTVPIWYAYTPGEQPWILTGTGSRKHRLIEEAGYFSLMADRLEPTVRYVAVDGAVASITDGDDADNEAMTRRYLSGESAEKFLAASPEFGPHVVIRMDPQHWNAADLGAL